MADDEGNPTGADSAQTAATSLRKNPQITAGNARPAPQFRLTPAGQMANRIAAKPEPFGLAKLPGED
jgi:hypothetical protein